MHTINLRRKEGRKGRKQGSKERKKVRKEEKEGRKKSKELIENVLVDLAKL